MPRTDRVLRLVQLLRQRGVVTAATLARELGVSKRTVYRDVRDLEESGVPVEGEAGVGYRLARGFELPPLTFNAAEIEALVLGARMVQAAGDPERGEAARSALERWSP
jgi:predicted DNA-binding transcriptional regulator YafY